MCHLELLTERVQVISLHVMQLHFGCFVLVVHIFQLYNRIQLKKKKKKCTLYSWLKFYCMIKTEIYCLNTCTYFFFFFVLMSICMANIHLEILKKQFLIKWCLQVCEICFINTNKIYKFFFQAFMVSTNFV